MTQVMQAQKKENGTAKLLSIAGGVIGGIYGGPSGAATGMSLGNQVGGAMSSAQGSQTQVPESAFSRRLQQSPSAQPPSTEMDSTKTLEDARFALAQQSPEVQQQYGPAIQAALLKSRRSQGAV